jgi:hypothetical protein
VADIIDRGPIPLSHPEDVEHRRIIAMRVNSSFPKDGTEGMQQPLRLMSYTVATVPTASLWTGSMIYVSDEAGGATTAFSDGTDWRRSQDRTIVA